MDKEALSIFDIAERAGLASPEKWARDQLRALADNPMEDIPPLERLCTLLFPIGNGKSTILVLTMLAFLHNNPTMRAGIIGCNRDMAENRKREALRLAQKADLDISPHQILIYASAQHTQGRGKDVRIFDDTAGEPPFLDRAGWE